MSTKRAKAARAPKKRAGGDLGSGGVVRGGKANDAAQRVISAVAAMREVLAANPQATVADVDAELQKRGIDKPLGTIATIRSDFLAVYRALAKAGALKSPVELK